ncbi:MAG: hypothetical protein GPOALKHO_000189 [Sodalis sp.]|nr:MAG: hypothetical protein GPOALKHO_000189 [Sodalis sp.]
MTHEKDSKMAAGPDDDKNLARQFIRLKTLRTLAIAGRSSLSNTKLEPLIIAASAMTYWRQPRTNFNSRPVQS